MTDGMENGEVVLVRGVISDNGRSVRIAPGVELAVASVDVVVDLPVPPDGMPVAMVLFFEDAESRADFAESFCDLPGVDTRDL